MELGLTSLAWSTTPDFLTSLTNAEDRTTRAAFKGRVPNSADDWAMIWASSTARARLRQQVHEYNSRYPMASPETLKKLENSSLLPFAIRIPQQISLCAVRGLLRTKNDLNAPVSGVFGNLILGLILGSMFYNLSEDANSFFSRGVVLFITVFLNTSLAGFEVGLSRSFMLAMLILNNSVLQSGI